MACTLQDIADRTGFSTSTIRQIFNGRAHRFSEKTQALVRAAATEMGYMPSAAARSVRRGRFDAVGVLLRHGGSNQDHNILKGVYEAARNYGLSVTYGETEDSQLHDPDLAPRLLKERCVDGFIVHHGQELDPRVTENLRRLGVPIIWVNADEPCNCVRPDDEGAVTRAVHFLLEQGHQRIGWVNMKIRGQATTPPRFRPHYSSPIREYAYRQVCRSENVPTQTLVETTETFEAMIRSLAAFLTQADAPTAIISNAPVLTPELVIAAQRLNINLSLPRSVITFSSRPFVPLEGLELHNLLVPGYKMGLEAVRLLRERIENNGSDLPAMLVEYPALAQEYDPRSITTKPIGARERNKVC